MANGSSQKEKPLYNSRIIDSYIKLIKSRYPHIDVGNLLSSAGMKAYEVADQNHWFSQSQVNRFHEVLQNLTGNLQIAREAGRYATSPDATGVMRQYILGFITPEKAYEMIGRATRNFTRSSEFKSRKIADNTVEITVTPVDGITERPFQCENRIGFIEAMGQIFTNRLPSVEHQECMFRGGDKCRYVVSWEVPFSAIIKRIRNFLGLLSLAAIGASLMYASAADVAIVLSLSLVAVMGLTSVADTQEKTELRKTLHSLRDSTENLIEQMNVNYKNALMTNEIGQVISRQTNIDDVLRQVIRTLVELLGYDRGMVLLSNSEKTRLQFRAGFGYTDDQFLTIKNAEFHLDKPESTGVFVVSFRENRPFLINDVNDLENSISPRSLRFAKRMGAQSFICCPILRDGESLGILTVDNIRSKRPLVHSDMSLLMGIAPIIGISIRNAELLESKTRQFDAILHALAASIDARDPLTAGHSEMVTEYACGICDELGLSKEFREVIRVAALLHDYGKIAVPDAILKKKGKLNPSEYEIVKAHAVKTREILNRINFEGYFAQVPEIASAHHEKMDGSGYPRGLRGEEIPLGARIIAVADFFEAVTAQRHYRDPMPYDRAMELLQKEATHHFDTDVVDAFLRYCDKSQAIQTLRQKPKPTSAKVIRMNQFSAR